MQLDSLQAISPIDGRYRTQVEALSPFFSEYGLIRYRVWVEVEYFLALCQIPLPPLADFPAGKVPMLRQIYQNFEIKDALRIKEIEATTNHDVKAVEYFIKEAMERLELGAYSEWIHFGLTSQDVNNTAIPMSLRHATEQVYLPLLEELTQKLATLAQQWEAIPMLARTHGQPASPTRLGKELMVFVERLEEQLGLLTQIPFAGKFGGATGNFNAHHVAYPHIDWVGFAEGFLAEQLGLKRSRTTTQIEHYDHLAAYSDALSRINTILIDLCRDVWQYVSMNYFKQKIKAGEVGSSAMPHKVNPIDFENAEGNLGVANVLWHHLSSKLPISRLQRDLTDSTVLRNLGVPMAHTVLAMRSCLKGLGKLELNQTAIEADLAQNWAVVAEAIQTILRREGFPNPYETLKALTRTHQAITQETIADFIDTLDLNDALKAELKAISPMNYTGV
ncbi:adenylosuccinate lyase [Eisenibacter elegans]|jgi:adenylosuccinate lyase|uniref:adenylosuccinate lyase n=1 Tax=Eisenibacter elegans TaxID=997 RepID=UPI0004265446|nr:adenylosuccinate lyase [Eisenibacter elegans]